MPALRCALRFFRASRIINGMIDIDALIRTVDLVLMISFWSICGLLLVNFLFGLLYGWKHGTYRLLFLSIMTVAILACSSFIANGLGGINIGQWLKNPISITIQGTTVQVAPDTLYNMVRDGVFKILKDCFKVQSSIEALQNYATAAAASLLRFVIIILTGILVFSVGNFLCWFFWIILFKHFIPKDKRKPKLRIISAFESLVVATICLALVITPITGIVNTVNGHVDANGLNSKEQTVQLYQKVMKSYDDSLLNKAFFAWTRGSGNETFDTQLTEFLSQANYENMSANIVTEVRSMVSTGGGLLNLVASSPNGQVANTLMFTPVNFLSQTMAQMLTFSGDEGLDVLADVTALASKLSRDTIGLSSAIGDDTIGKLSYAKENGAYLKRCRSLYRNLVSSGYIETEVDPAISLKAYPVEDDLYDALTSDASLQALENALSSSYSSRVVESVLRGYVYDRSSDENVMTLLPDARKEDGNIASYPYLQDAYNIVKTFHGLNQIDEGAAKAVVERIHQADSSSSAQEGSEIASRLLGALAKNHKAFIKLFVGERDANREPIVNDKGLSNEGCFMDSGLVNAAFPVGLEISAAMLNEQLFKDSTKKIDLSKVATSLQNQDGSPNYVANKKECAAMLDVAGDMLENPYGNTEDETLRKNGQAIVDAASTLLSDFRKHTGIDLDPEGGLYDYDTDLFKAVANGMLAIDRSAILTAMMPTAADYFLTRVDTLQSFGIETIQTAPIEEGKSVLGRELAKFVTLGAQCRYLLPSFLRLGNFTLDSVAQALKNHEEEFVKILDVAADSLILNPVIDGVSNVNLTKVFNFLFEKIQIENVLEYDALNGIQMVSTYPKAASIVDSYAGDPVAYGENAHMVVAVGRIMASGILDRLTDMASTNDIASHLIGCDMEEIFSAIGDSVVLRKVLPGYFDSKVLEALLDNDKKLDLQTMGITFRNLVSQEDWANEGERFQNLIDLAARGLDLSNFDLFKDGTVLVDLMSQMSGSMMFQPLASSITDPDPSLVIPAEESPDGIARYYSFPDYFAQKILNSAGSNASYFEDENPTGDKAIERCSSFYEACLQLNRPALWTKNASHTGEFDALDGVFVDLKSLGSFDALSKISADNLPELRSALLHISQSYSFSTVLVANALGQALEKVDAGKDIDFKAAYSAYFYDVHRDPVVYDRAAAYALKEAEITRLMDTLDTLYDPSYGLVDAAGKVDVSKISIKTVSTDNLLRPLLTSAHQSKLFNPGDADLGSRAAAYHAAHDATVFQQMIGSITMNSGVYKIDTSRADMDWKTKLSSAVDKSGTLLGYPSDQSVYSIITGLADNAWEGVDGEIEHFCDLIDFIQESGFIDGDGNLSTDVFNDISAYFGYDLTTKLEKIDEMTTLFHNFNAVECFRRALPYYLSNAIDNGNYGESIGKDIKCADFYFTLSGSDYGAYSDSDIGNMVDVMFYLSSCASADFGNIASIDAMSIGNALNAMYGSGPFDTNKTKANSIFDVAPTDPNYATYEAKKNHTCFENLFADLIATDALSDYYYYAASPKDTFHTGEGDYSLATGKALYYIAQTKANEADLMDDRIFEFCDFIDLLGSPSLSPFVSGGASTDFASMDGTTLSAILHGLNEAYFLRDVVPNALHKTMWDGAYDILGIDLSLANIYFSYEWVDADGNLKAIHSLDYEVPFYEPEIDQLCYVVDAMKNNKSNMSEFDVSFVDPMVVRTMLADLYNSYIFHEAGPNKGADGNYSETWAYYRAEDGYGWAKSSETSSTGTVFRKNDLTIFEQFVQKIYFDSGLANQNLELTQSEDDLKLYLEAREGTRATVKHMPDLSAAGYDDYVQAAGLYKLHDAIVSFNNHSLTDVSGTALTTYWMDEISAITTDGHRHNPGVDRAGQANDASIGLVDTVQRLGLDTADVQLGDDSMNKYQPFELYSLFEALNNCQVGNAVMPNAFARFVSGKSDGGSGLGLNVYSNDQLALSDGTSLSFSANDYGMPSKVAFTYEGTQASIKVKYGTYDVTELVSFDKSGYKYKANVAKLPAGFVVEGDGTHEFTDATVDYDRADYRISQGAYRDKAIVSVYYFFTSMFRGDVDTSTTSYYYAFSEDAVELVDFLDDAKCRPGFKHSTFGLFSMILDSGIFDTKKTTEDFAAKDFVLYNLFHVTAEIPTSGSPIEASLGMGDEFGTFGLTDRYDSAAGIHEVTSAATDMKAFCFQEAAYFDQFIADIGFLDAFVNKTYYDNATGTPTPDVIRLTEKYLLANDASDAYAHLYAGLGSSTFAPYAITLYGTEEGAGNANYVTESDAYEEPGAFAKGILYGIAKKFSYSYNVYAKQASHPGLFVLAPATGSRASYFSTDAIAGLTDGQCSLIGVNEAFDRTGDKLDVVQALGKAFKALEYYHAGSGSKSDLSTTIASFASANASASALLEQFYLGDLYDCLASILDARFDSNNVYYDYRGSNNKLGGTDKAFSYADVASIVAL